MVGIFLRKNEVLICILFSDTGFNIHYYKTCIDDLLWMEIFKRRYKKQRNIMVWDFVCSNVSVRCDYGLPE